MRLTSVSKQPPKVCPKCGCNVAQKWGKVKRWGDVWQRWRCDNDRCGHIWTGAPEEKPEERNGLDTVPYVVMRCPECESERTFVTKTMRPIRYHECRTCRATFKSEE